MSSSWGSVPGFFRHSSFVVYPRGGQEGPSLPMERDESVEILVYVLTSHSSFSVWDVRLCKSFFHVPSSLEYHLTERLWHK